ncbi:conserved hypothetical protein [Ricinus communis]|uniref:Uncharacterized protein n=1 Tax=Ricinus communis TaxID=3988 RepID=B9S3L8_RICCO|nr:conserved hypothetical protein [Ricinus communis]
MMIQDGLYIRHERKSHESKTRNCLLHVSGGMVHESGAEGSTGIGTFLGWAMAAIYMGGRLPQILLNLLIWAAI